jgi:glycosyltransferase involved in cell wall biosynthesis
VRRHRVLLVIAQLDMGGAERQLLNLALRLSREGFDPEVAVFYPGGHFESALTQSGVAVHHIRRTSKVGLEAILDLRRLIRDRRYDVVHSFLWPANWRSRLAAVLARAPVIVSSTRSVETWLRFYHVAADRILARWTHAIVVNATAIRRFLVEREGVPERIITVIRNGVDTRPFESLPSRTDARRRLGLPTDHPVVLSVANLQPEKNHEDLLRVAALVAKRHPGVCFVAVGSGERQAALEAMSRSMGLEGVVRWAGFQTDVTPYLAACDVFMNTSRREGCCNAILEAMASAKPVVAYAVGGNPELVIHGASGRLAAFGDVDGLADAVVGYLDDPDLAARQGAAGATQMKEQFSVEAMARRTADLYRTLLAGLSPHDAPNVRREAGISASTLGGPHPDDSRLGHDGTVLTHRPQVLDP